MTKRLVEFSITLIVACVCVFFVVKYTISSPHSKIAEQLGMHNASIERLSNSIDTQTNMIQNINDNISNLDSSQDKYIQAIKENTKWQQINYRQMQKLKANYDEKVKSASSYNYRQVDSFFASRYGKYKGN